MCIVRIDILKNDDLSFLNKVGEIVYRSLKEAIRITYKDYVQILSEHSKGSLIFNEDFLSIKRTDGFIFIQILLSDEKTNEQKKDIYKTIASYLNIALKVRKEDIMINIIEIKKENWSFSNGEFSRT